MPNTIYKVECLDQGEPFYTEDIKRAKMEFEAMLLEYGTGIRMYETENPEMDDDEIIWELIEASDEIENL